MAHARWVGTLAGVVLVALPSCGGGVAPPTAPPPPPAPSSPAPAASEPEPFWQTIAAPPTQRKTAAFAFEIPGGVLLGDRGGGRHFRPSDGEGRSAARLDPSPHAVLLHVPEHGLVTCDRDGKIRRSPDPLGPLEIVGDAPVGAELDSLRAHRGGFTIGTRRGAMFSTDLASWQPLSWLGDRRPHRALLGADGVGLGLFTPQALASTHDGGKTWVPIDDAGVLATALQPAGDEILVEPGGVSDAYFRSWKRGQKALARALREPRNPPWTQPVEQLGVPSQLLDHGDRIDGRHTSLRGLIRGEAALSGDVAYYLHKGALGTRPLGGAVVWEEIAELSELGTCKGIATCGDRLAIGCQQGVWLQEGERRRVVWGETPLSMGFAGPDELVLATKSGINRIDLTSSNPAVVDLQGAPSKERYGKLTVRGSCSSGAAWIEKEGTFFRYEGKGGQVTPVGKPPFGADAIIGTHPNGSPVFAAGTGHAKRKGVPVLGYFDADGFRELELPFQPMHQHGHVEAHLASFEQGRGMLLDAEGDPHLTADAGKSWVEIDGPPGYEPASTLRPIACGATRCEIQDVAVSVGWSARQKSQAPRSGPDLALDLVCERAEPEKLTTPHADFVLGVVDFGVGSALVSSTLSTDVAGLFQRTERVPGTNEVFALHGFSDGSSKRTRLTRTAGTTSWVYGFMPFVRMGSLAVAASPVPNTLEALSVGWHGGAGAPARTTKFGASMLPRPSVEATLATPDGLVLLDRLGAMAMWIDATGVVGKRPWPSREIPTDTVADHEVDEHTKSSLVEVSDGRWIAMSPLGDHVRLVSIAEDGYATSRPQLFRSEAATLTLLDGRAQLVSVEIDRSGTHELRRRPVGDDLRLGDAVPIESGLEDGDLTSLAACSSEGEGILRAVELGEGRARVVGSADETVVDGQVVVQLRVSAEAACVRRVMIRGLDRLVAMGGGTGAAAWQHEVPDAEAGKTVASLLDCRAVSAARR